jgi:hypothetical protein
VYTFVGWIIVDMGNYRLRYWIPNAKTMNQIKRTTPILAINRRRKKGKRGCKIENRGKRKTHHRFGRKREGEEKMRTFMQETNKKLKRNMRRKVKVKSKRLCIKSNGHRAARTNR